MASATPVGSSADEIAPAHVRERPEWITDLLNLGTTTFRKTVTQKSDQLAKRGDNPGTFSTTIPLWMIKLDVFSIPCAWPLKGTVEKIKAYWYDEQMNPKFSFPPPGMVMEIAYYSAPISAEQIGTFERENLDAHLMAWLMKMAESKDGEEKLQLFKEYGNHVLVHFDKRVSSSEKMVRAYQLKEDPAGRSCKCFVSKF